MKCYQHNEIDAVGICKHCQKGVCKECVLLTDDCVACIACQDKVKFQISLFERNRRIIGTQPKTMNTLIWLTTIIGIAIIGGGFLFGQGVEMLPVGGIFLGMGVVYWFLRRSRK